MEFVVKKKHILSLYYFSCSISTLTHTLIYLFVCLIVFVYQAITNIKVNSLDKTMPPPGVQVIDLLFNYIYCMYFSL